MPRTYDSNAVALREYMAAEGNGYHPEDDPDVVNCNVCGEFVHIDKAKARFVFQNSAWAWEYSCRHCYVPDDEE